MVKSVDNKLWQSFIEMLNEENTFNTYFSYYSALVSWVKKNSDYFNEDIKKSSGLDVLIELDPENYVINDIKSNGISLETEIKRIGRGNPKKINILARRIGATLWDMVTISSSKNCPRCIHGGLIYLFAEDIETKERELILQCESCYWTENIEGTHCIGKQVKLIPANKKDLNELGVDDKFL